MYSLFGSQFKYYSFRKSSSDLQNCISSFCSTSQHLYFSFKTFVSLILAQSSLLTDYNLHDFHSCSESSGALITVSWKSPLGIKDVSHVWSLAKVFSGDCSLFTTQWYILCVSNWWFIGICYLVCTDTVLWLFL